MYWARRVVLRAGARRGPVAIAVIAVAVIVSTTLYLLVPPPQLAYAAQVRVQCANAESDAAMINDAISVDSSPGDEIVISGTCLINETIKLLGDRSYRGESHSATVLKQADSADLDAMMASDSYLQNSETSGRPISVRHMRLEGNRDNNTAATSGIVLRSFYSKIEDMQIVEMGGNGIRLTSVAVDGATALTNTMVDGQISMNFIRNNSDHGIYVEDPVNAVTDWHLIGNIISASGLDGIHLENGAGWLIRGNNVYTADQNAISVHRMFGTVISDNYIEPFGNGAEAGTWYGIRGTVQGGRPSTISGNTISATEATAGSTYRYLGIVRVNSGTGVLSVTGNAIRYVGSGTSGGTGLDYRKDTGAGLTVASTGNAVADVATPIFVGTGVTVTAGV